MELMGVILTAEMATMPFNLRTVLEMAIPAILVCTIFSNIVKSIWLKKQMEE